MQSSPAIAECPTKLIPFIRCRNISFETHVQIVAELITYASSCETGWLKLAGYSIAQSVEKIIRRYKGVGFGGLYLESLRDLNTSELTELSEESAAIPWSTGDSEHIRVAAASNVFDGSRYPSLTDMAANPPSDEVLPVSRYDQRALEFLQQFHECLRAVLQRAGDLLKALRNCLRRASATVQNTADALRNVMQCLGFLAYLAWKSPFFEWYITIFLGARLSRVRANLLYRSTAPKGALEPRRNDPSNTRTMGFSTNGNSRNYGEHDQKMDLASDRLRIEVVKSTRNWGTQAPGEPTCNPASIPEADILDDSQPSIEWLAWLRLVTACIRYPQRVSRFHMRNVKELRLQVVRYPPSTKQILPWKELMVALFPTADERAQINELLTERLADDISDHSFTFKGRIHCEAMLATLHHLSKRSNQQCAPDSVDQAVLDSLATAKSLIAPSKRCCPPCATILRLLSKQPAASHYKIMGQHQYIFPCALPTGLPAIVRKELLKEYDLLLTEHLMNLYNERRESFAFGQSTPLSDSDHDSGDEMCCELVGGFEVGE
jgi:hypothetical protein